jgi:hypothetical protein
LFDWIGKDIEKGVSGFEAGQDETWETGNCWNRTGSMKKIVVQSALFPPDCPEKGDCHATNQGGCVDPVRIIFDRRFPTTGPIDALTA